MHTLIAVLNQKNYIQEVLILSELVPRGVGDVLLTFKIDTVLGKQSYSSFYLLNVLH